MPTISVDEVVDEARGRTGLDRFDAETFREGLEIFLSDFCRQTGLPDWGVASTKELIVTALSSWHRVTAYLEERPELLDRPVERPVFVFGIPRTGTTLL